MDFKTNLLSYMEENEVCKLFDSFSKEPKHAALLNPLQMSDEEFLSLFPHVKKHPFVEHAYIYDKNEYDLGKTLYHDLGCFYLQDPSAMMVSHLLPLNENDVILDLCAAPGGKTIQASMKMKGKGVIYGNDISKSRCEILLENVERLGLSNVLIINNDFNQISSLYQNYFDAIILDAPCSGSGMFRKERKMMDDWSINKVIKYAEIQKQLINICYQMLKPGGILSYSTCSYSHEENEEVILDLLSNTDAHLVSLPTSPDFYISKSKIGIHLLSSKFEGEGQYICQIQKPGNKKVSHFINLNKYHLPIKEDGHINKFGQYLFYLPMNVKTDKLSILRYGLKIGEIGKDYFKYDFHFGRSHISDLPHITLSDKEVKQYIHGESLSILTKEKGYYLIKYHNSHLSVSKSDGQILKNNYPKKYRR